MLSNYQYSVLPFTMLRFRQVKTATLTLLLCGTANAQSGPLISFLILPSARLKLRLPGGERIHQALTRSAQPPLLPSASFYASCGVLFFSAHDGSVLHCIQFKRADDCSFGECVNCSPAKAIKMGLVSKNRSRTALAGY